MKLHQLIEMALTARQENRFLNKLDKEIDRKGYPNPRKMRDMLKDVEPEARQLGKGSASTAFGKEGSKSVIKISKVKDPCAFLFLNWAWARPASKHLPKIYALAEPVKGHIYVRMEPLKGFNFEKYPWQKKHLPFLIFVDDTHASEDLDYFPAVPHSAYLKALGFKKKADMPNDWRGKRSRSAKYGYKKLFSKKKATELHRASKKRYSRDPLIKAAKGIKALVRKHRKICWHDPAPNRNWLTRPSTGDIVFADPVATFFKKTR